jgi:hypothetical protein
MVDAPLLCPKDFARNCDSFDILNKFGVSSCLCFSEQFDLMFVEEPVLPGDADAMKEISRSTSIPIAAGERLFTRWQVKISHFFICLSECKFVHSSFKS